jgi:hypothetical protein
MMTEEKKSANGQIYHLKVTLVDSKPPVWRRIQVPSDITLHRLHLIIQTVMGWANYYMYRFEINGRNFEQTDTEMPLGYPKTSHSGRIKLNKAVPYVKTRFLYEYDFGDGWEHRILLEKILPTDPKIRYPVCVAGERACPPEDCGGIWGYYELLEILKDPKHKRYKEMIRWLDGPYDPEAFDIDDVNNMLRRRIVTTQPDAYVTEVNGIKLVTVFKKQRRGQSKTIQSEE